MTTQDPASAAAPIQGVEYRYRLYELDAQSRSAVKHIWPIIAPDLDKAVDARRPNCRISARPSARTEPSSKNSKWPSGSAAQRRRRRPLFR
ncbi:MAG: hypothetical protein WBE48_13985, partial [Xanthobacteraceae bacterium]